MRTFLRLLSSWKFLPNRDRIFYKSQKEAFREYMRMAGASLLFHIGFAAFIVFPRRYISGSMVLSFAEPRFWRNFVIYLLSFSSEIDFEISKAFTREFAFPTPDIVYDVKRKISPDFDLYCKYGEKAEFQLDLSNKVRMFQQEEKRQKHTRESLRPKEARFGGAV